MILYQYKLLSVSLSPKFVIYGLCINSFFWLSFLNWLWHWFNFPCPLISFTFCKIKIYLHCLLTEWPLNPRTALCLLTPVYIWSHQRSARSSWVTLLVFYFWHPDLLKLLHVHLISDSSMPSYSPSPSIPSWFQLPSSQVWWVVMLRYLNDFL